MPQVKETTENALSQAMHKTLSTMNKLLFRSDIGPTTSLFRASLTLASTARVEVQPGVQVSHAQLLANSFMRLHYWIS